MKKFLYILFACGFLASPVHASPQTIDESQDTPSRQAAICLCTSDFLFNGALVALSATPPLYDDPRLINPFNGLFASFGLLAGFTRITLLITGIIKRDQCRDVEGLWIVGEVVAHLTRAFIGTSEGVHAPIWPLIALNVINGAIILSGFALYARTLLPQRAPEH